MPIGACSESCVLGTAQAKSMRLSAVCFGTFILKPVLALEFNMNLSFAQSLAMRWCGPLGIYFHYTALWLRRGLNTNRMGISG